MSSSLISLIDSGLVGRGAARAEDTHGTPTLFIVLVSFGLFDLVWFGMCGVTFSYERGTPVERILQRVNYHPIRGRVYQVIQGYLARKKQPPPPRTAIGA